MKHKYLWGVLAVIAASLCYGITPILSNITLHGGLPAEFVHKLLRSAPEILCADASRALPNESLVGFVMGLAFLMSLVSCFTRKKNFKINFTQAWQLTLFGGITLATSALMCTYAYLHIPAGLTIVIHSIFPVFVLVFLMLFFKEKFRFIKLVSLAVAITGIVLVSNNSLEGKTDMLGIVFSLISGMAYAVYFIAGYKAAYSKLDTSVTSVYITGVAAVIVFCAAFIRKKFSLPKDLFIWTMLVLEAFLGYVFALRLILYGIKLLGSVTASALNMLEPVFASLISMAVFGESMGLLKGLGAILVLTAAVISIFTLKKGDMNCENPRKTT